MEAPEYTTDDLPLLQRIDFARGIRGIPPMPASLRNTLTIIRLMPTLMQALLGLVLFTNPIPPTGVTSWIYATYGFSPLFYGVWALFFALISLWWSYNAPFRRALALRVGGMIVWTFPSLFYVLCSDWYLIAVATTSPRAPIVFYSMLYVMMISMYMANALLAIWFDQIRQLQARGGKWIPLL